MTTTPTGIPIIMCEKCGQLHPSHTRHCDICGRASRFIDGGICIRCEVRK